MSRREWGPIIASLIAGEALDYDQSYWLMDQVMSGELGEARLASFLTAMAIKGATVEEIHGLADGMQDHAQRVDLPSRALDIVGTGGGRLQDRQHFDHVRDRAGRDGHSPR